MPTTTDDHAEIASLPRRHGLTGPGTPLRYAAAGLVNSAAGYAAILAFAAAGAPPALANAGGFGVGFLISLAVASAWTFGPARRGGASLRYGAGFLGCYAANLGAVSSMLSLGLPAPLAQAGGVGTYAVLFYLTCRWWVYGQADVRRGDVAMVRALAGRIGAPRHG